MARIAFLGTPDIAVPALDALVAADDLDVVVAVTNPDRPRGRSRTPVPPPVKVAAEGHGVPVWQPARPRDVADDLRALDLDAGAIVAYGALLPREVLDAPGRGLVNLHFSALPRWRGAAPVQHAIRAGDDVIGVTTFVLDEGMDTGPVLDRVELPLDPEANSGQVLDLLARLGAPLLVHSVRSLIAGRQPTPQPEEGATLAPKITPEDVRIDWSVPAREVLDLIRSANPAPGAHTAFAGRRLKVWRARPAPPADGAPGEIVDAADDGPAVATGAGAVVLTEVQPEGKPRMAGTDFVNGYGPVGTILGA